MTEAPQILSEHRMAVYLLDSLGDIHKLRWQDEVGTWNVNVLQIFPYDIKGQ